MGWPVVVVLGMFLAGSLYLVSRVHEDAVSGDSPPQTRLDDAGVDDGGGSYVHHAWGTDAAASAPPARRRYDPHRDRMALDFPNDAGVELPFAPVELPLRLMDVRGEPPIGTDREPCWLRVLPVNQPPFNCAVRVLCDGRVVYPNPSLTAGFNQCSVRDGAAQVADDRDPTEVDSDPYLRLDLGPRGRVRVGDRRDGEETYRLFFRVVRE